MTALLLIDNAHTHDDTIADASAQLMMSRVRVRTVSSDNIKASDFDDVRVFIMACDMPILSDDVSVAVEQCRLAGMATIRVVDVANWLQTARIA